MNASATFFSEFFHAELSHLTNLITLDMTERTIKIVAKKIGNGEDQTYSMMKH